MRDRKMKFVHTHGYLNTSKHTVFDEILMWHDATWLTTSQWSGCVDFSRRLLDASRLFKTTVSLWKLDKDLRCEISETFWFCFWWVVFNFFWEKLRKCEQHDPQRDTLSMKSMNLMKTSSDEVSVRCLAPWATPPSPRSNALCPRTEKRQR